MWKRGTCRRKAKERSYKIAVLLDGQYGWNLYLNPVKDKLIEPKFPKPCYFGGVVYFQNVKVSQIPGQFC